MQEDGECVQATGRGAAACGFIGSLGRQLRPHQISVVLVRRIMIAIVELI